MKVLSGAIAALTSLTVAASAADLPSTPAYSGDSGGSYVSYDSSPSMAYPAYDWTGFYIGVNGGYQSTNWKVDSIAGRVYNPAKISAGGFLAGGTVGYNYHMPNNVVVGLEGDVAWTNVSKEASQTIALIGASTKYATKVESNLYASLRPRIGYAAGGLMPYVTGGLAMARTKIDRTNVVTIPGSTTPVTTTAAKSLFRIGWTVGAGAEFGIGSNISFKGEYLYNNFGKKDYAFSNVAIPDLKYDLQSHVFRVGLNYRFN